MCALEKAEQSGTFRGDDDGVVQEGSNTKYGQTRRDDMKAVEQASSQTGELLEDDEFMSSLNEG